MKTNEAPQVAINLPNYGRTNMCASKQPSWTNQGLDQQYLASVEAYRTFVYEWRRIYRYISAFHRDGRLGGRLSWAEHMRPTKGLTGKDLVRRQNLGAQAFTAANRFREADSPDLAAWYKAQIQRASYGNPFITPKGRQSLYGEAVASWLLWLRADGKAQAKNAPWFTARNVKPA